MDQSFPLISLSPQRIPRKSVPRKAVPLSSPGRDKHSSGFKSVSRNHLGYGYSPIQIPSSSVCCNGTAPYQDSPPSHSPHSLSPPQPQKDRRGLLSGGWRSGCTYSASITTGVFFVNVCLTIWAFCRNGGEDGIGTIYQGDCNLTKKLSLVAHLFINALGTILLGASNYTMQCLSAPTRGEIDKAHSEKKWLDIGVPSVKNLARINKKRLILWSLLGMSSVPLHFIYNSAVFSTSSTYNYMTRIMAEGNITITNIADYEKLENRECMITYGKQFISDRRDVVIVVNSQNGSEVIDSHILSTSTVSMEQTFDWICESFDDFRNSGDIYNKPCKVNDYLDRADVWAMNGTVVNYCLSERMNERCSLQYSLHIMIAVIVCNSVKAICMFLTVFKNKDDPLVTIGDAIASFLNNPDKTTAGMCTVSKSQIVDGYWGSSTTTIPRPWKPHKSSWFSAASGSRWVICNVLASIGIGVVAWLLSESNDFMDHASLSRDLPSLWAIGFGAIDVRLMMEPIIYPYRNETYKGLIGCIITANLAQAIFSFLYLLYNSIFTCMLLGDEWDRFSHQRRSLRVTTPVGSQRSTYFLQLPYTYSIPLIVISGFMHWLISQCIFLARISVIFQSYGEPEYSEAEMVSMVGWSPIAISVALFMAILILLTAIVNGFRTYGDGIPLVGHCSAAISAACHPDPREFSPATEPLMWGVVSSAGEVGHCSFSSEEVTEPIPDQKYAGHASGRDHINLDYEVTRSRGKS